MLLLCSVIADVGQQQLGELSVGQIIKVKVTSVTDDGVLCSRDHGVRGLVTTDHMPGIYTLLHYASYFHIFAIYASEGRSILRISMLD